MYFYEMERLLGWDKEESWNYNIQIKYLYAKNILFVEQHDF